MFDQSWEAALMDIRVHSRYRRQGLGTFVLNEALRHLIKRKQVFQIEAHISEEAPFVLSLLNSMRWRVLETGTIFRKEIR